ncbi:MAG: phosphate acyltransferase PlsX [Planctomycetota bacterium]
MRIALDAMGGDHAPAEVVQGALRALKDEPDATVILVGREDAIRKELEGAPDFGDRLAIVHAEDVVDCHESPVEALRKKKDNSIVKAIGLVAMGKADAFVSAGNTGAVVGASQFVLKLVPGIRRAGIAVALGTRDNKTVVIDVGANVHCKPVHLLHYGVMASIYAEKILGIENPRVALLNIGEEEAKGNPLVKETRDLFATAPFNYTGMAEGNHVFAHKADVIVCEGFVGNVMLKVSEGLAEVMHREFESVFGGYVRANQDPELEKTIGRFRRNTDYAEEGAAPLLGVNGNVLICHGRSDRRAIGNAVKTAARFVRAGVVDRIAAGVSTTQSSES